MKRLLKHLLNQLLKFVTSDWFAYHIMKARVWKVMPWKVRVWRWEVWEGLYVQKRSGEKP